MSVVLEAREADARYLDAMQPALVRQFELLATASDSAGRLRSLILSLAVQGKLVAQDQDDEPGFACLERIQSGRSHRRQPAARPISPTKPDPREEPFQLPNGWTWASMADVAQSRLGKMLDKGKNVGRLHPYIRNTNVQWGRFDLEDIKLIRLDDREVDEFRLQPGDLLVCEGGEPGRCAIWPAGGPDMYFQKALHRIRPEGGVSPRFLAICLEEDARSGRLAKHFTGATIKHFSGQELEKYSFALPPVAEQARIVARVDELMRACDALGAKGRLEAEQHARLLDTLLGTLTDSRSPEELAANWQRVAAHFDLLLDRPEAVDALEQRILQLAVRGTLVCQDSTDEPASDFLRKAQIAKAQLGASRTPKSDALNALLDADDVPLKLPPGWLWVRFGAVVSISSGVTLGRKTPIVRPVLRPYLRVANVQRWRLDLSSVKDIVIDQSELARFQLRAGDLLITEGGDWDKVGRTAIWRDELAECLHQNHIFKARAVTGEWLPAWAELYLNSDIARTYFAYSAKQTTNLASINMTELKACPFPLPPIAEQARILARVDQLRRMCAELREKLTAVRAVQTRLAEALTQDAVRSQP